MTDDNNEMIIDRTNNVKGINRAGLGHPNSANAKAQPVEDAESQRIRAAIRLAEIRARKVSSPENNGDFYIPADVIPSGWTYEWKRHSVYGKEDPQYMSSMMRDGWSPVSASRHPELLYSGYEGETIIHKGLILCERPEELTRESRIRDNRAAIEQVASREALLGATPQGEMQRTAPKLNRSMGPAEIPA